MAELTHVDGEGRASMVDVSGKADTLRSATATGSIAMSPEALARALGGTGPKGAVEGVAEIAGVMAAKRTADLIPLVPPAGAVGDRGRGRAHARRRRADGDRDGAHHRPDRGRDGGADRRVGGAA